MYKIIGANQAEYGPVTTEQLRQWIAEGRVNAQTLAQAEGETGWRPISTYPDFAASFPAGAAPVTPAASPAQGFAPSAGRDAARGMVSAPAIALIVTGALGILLGLWFLFSTLTGSNAIQQLQSNPAFANNPALQQNPQLLKMGLKFDGAWGAVSILYCAFIIFCAVKMLKCESHGLAMTGAILAMLPCNCCCCLGLPFGIWALVVLNKAEVRSSFT